MDSQKSSILLASNLPQLRSSTMQSTQVLLFCLISIPAAISQDFGAAIIGTPFELRDDNITILQNTICLSNINQARANNGLGPVTVNLQVESAAYNHNSWMVRNNCFSHQCPGEAGLGDRLSATGYSWSGVGEILAKGQGDCVAAVNAWLGSPGIGISCWEAMGMSAVQGLFAPIARMLDLGGLVSLLIHGEGKSSHFGLFKYISRH